MSKKQADISAVIDDLSSQLSQSNVDNAILRNIVSQYEKELPEEESDSIIEGGE